MGHGAEVQTAVVNSHYITDGPDGKLPRSVLQLDSAGVGQHCVKLRMLMLYCVLFVCPTHGDYKSFIVIAVQKCDRAATTVVGCTS